MRPIREQPLKMLDDLGVYVPRAEVVYRDVLLKKGVKEKSIHFLGDACMSTVDEANSANRAFRGKDCSVLIVTSPYHVKRTQMIFKERMQNCKFRVLGTPYERFPKKWWTDQDSARNTILEVLKIIFYKAGGKFESSENVRGKE